MPIASVERLIVSTAKVEKYSGVLRALHAGGVADPCRQLDRALAPLPD